MKIIKNKKIELKKSEVSYIDLIINCIEAIATKGMQIKDMKKYLDVISKLESDENKEEIQIENDDFEIVKKAVTEMRWNIMDIKLIKFNEYLVKL